MILRFSSLQHHFDSSHYFASHKDNPSLAGVLSISQLYILAPSSWSESLPFIRSYSTVELVDIFVNNSELKPGPRPENRGDDTQIPYSTTTCHTVSLFNQEYVVVS